MRSLEYKVPFPILALAKGFFHCRIDRIWLNQKDKSALERPDG